MPTINDIQKEASVYACTKQAKTNAWFFKTEKGQYGEGDKFLGLRMPEQRKIAKQFSAASFPTITKLLKSKWHEERMIGLLILLYQFEKADNATKKKIFDFYIKNRAAVNNWDLVDATTPHIIGRYLVDKPRAERQFLYDYAQSGNLWERRIAILATFPFIKIEKFTDTLAIAEILLNDNEDLIHKAVGWMLREVGKKDEQVLCAFLDKNIRKLPRTSLRYAIERFPEPKRKAYLKK